LRAASRRACPGLDPGMRPGCGPASGEAQAWPTWFETRLCERRGTHCILAMALLTMRTQSPRVVRATRIETHVIVLARHFCSELYQLSLTQMRGRSAETALGCLRGTLSRASYVRPQALARRLTSLAIGTFASRRSTRGICGLRPSERTLLVATAQRAHGTSRSCLQGKYTGHRIPTCLS
jgi:hypothetical protein